MLLNIKGHGRSQTIVTIGTESIMCDVVTMLRKRLLGENLPLRQALK